MIQNVEFRHRNPTSAPQHFNTPMIPFIQKNDIDLALPYPALIERLKEAFAYPGIVTPQRHHHEITNPGETDSSTLLLMPAWLPGKNMGVKVVTVTPHNVKYDRPAIHGLYLLFDSNDGDCRLILDAKSLTVRRTAATSALASSFLSRKGSKTLLMVGTGALSSELVRAHASVRPINKVLVWGRHPEKAADLCQNLSGESFEATPVGTLEDGLAQADIVTCATLSESPLVLGKFLRPGQHVDLVGGYRPHMREADDDAIRKSTVFVDTYAGALHECGDMLIPIQSGILSKEKLGGELPELCGGLKKGRQSESEITLFKSVGHALEDLVAAMMVVENLPGVKN